MQKLLFSFSVIGMLSFSFSVQAVNIQHMKKRIEKSTHPPGQTLLPVAQKLACKAQKKPDCYAANQFQISRFALVQVHRLEQEDLFLFFQEEANKKWKLKGVTLPQDLNAGFLLTRSDIGESNAKLLLDKLKK